MDIKNYLSIEDLKIIQKVNCYILKHLDTDIEYKNYVKVCSIKAKADLRLSIFATFKTKRGDLTGEARRQRLIIGMLAGNANPAERTRTGLSQKIAETRNVAWKNIYSGVFRDLDEILLPLGLVEEDGRLPLKRGPKALQEKGIPYYHLTKKGILTAISIREMGDRPNLLERFFELAEPQEREFEGLLDYLLADSPGFAYHIIEKYVEAFCDGVMEDLLPFDLSRLAQIPDESLALHVEVLEAFMGLNKQQCRDALKMLNKMVFSDDGAKEGGDTMTRTGHKDGEDGDVTEEDGLLPQ